MISIHFRLVEGIYNVYIVYYFFSAHNLEMYSEKLGYTRREIDELADDEIV